MPQLSSNAPRGLASLFLGRNLSTHSCPTPPKVSPLRKPKNPFSSRQSSGLCPRPHPQKTQGPAVCRLVVALHIWRGKKCRAKERVDSISERHRRETPQTTHSHTGSHTHTHRNIQTQAYMLTHCPAGHTNSMDWPEGGWDEGKMEGRALALSIRDPR